MLKPLGGIDSPSLQNYYRKFNENLTKIFLRIPEEICPEVPLNVTPVITCIDFSDSTYSFQRFQAIFAGILPKHSFTDLPNKCSKPNYIDYHRKFRNPFNILPQKHLDRIPWKNF